MSDHQSCHHCEGKGYIHIRDCSAEIQREETCSFCEGLGYLEKDNQQGFPAIITLVVDPCEHGCKPLPLGSPFSF